MATFNKSDLTYNDYRWNEAADHNNPKPTPKPGSTLLNKTEGHEMLYFINTYLQKRNFKNISTGRKIERLIRASQQADKSHAYWTTFMDANL